MAPTPKYRELDRADIALLAKVLDVSNQHCQRSLIAHLPHSLRRQSPCVVLGCHDHKRLHMAPLDELVGQFLYEVGESRESIWLPLRNQSLFNGEQVCMLEKMSMISTFPASGCAACWLTTVGSDTDALVALGAFLSGRVNPGIYQKSKRLLWIETCLRQRLDKQIAAGQIRRMWEAGIELRRLRKTASLECDESRWYVGEYVRRARDLDVLPGIYRVPSQSFNDPTDVSMEHRTGNHRIVNPDAAGASSGSTPRPGSASQMIRQSRRPMTALDLDAEQQSKAREPPSNLHNQETTSSRPSPRSSTIFARHKMPEPGSAVPSTGTQIIDLYRRSNFPHNTAFDAGFSTDTRQSSSIDTRKRSSTYTGKRSSSDTRKRESTDTRERSPIYIFGQPSPERPQQRSSSRHDSRYDRNAVPPSNWPPVQEELHQRRRMEGRDIPLPKTLKIGQREER